MPPGMVTAANTGGCGNGAGTNPPRLSTTTNPPSPHKKRGRASTARRAQQYSLGRLLSTKATAAITPDPKPVSSRLNLSNIPTCTPLSYHEGIKLLDNRYSPMEDISAKDLDDICTEGDERAAVRAQEKATALYAKTVTAAPRFRCMVLFVLTRNTRTACAL